MNKSSEDNFILGLQTVIEGQQIMINSLTKGTYNQNRNSQIEFAILQELWDFSSARKELSMAILNEFALSKGIKLDPLKM